MGRPELPIDEGLVISLAKMHCTQVEIAKIVGCTTRTLRNRFKAQIAKGKAECKLKLRQLQWKSAESGNVTMQIFLGKQYLGQSDKTAIQESAPRPEKAVRAMDESILPPSASNRSVTESKRG